MSALCTLAAVAALNQVQAQLHASSKLTNSFANARNEIEPPLSPNLHAKTLRALHDNVAIYKEEVVMKINL
jgi:hypothetical protein